MQAFLLALICWFLHVGVSNSTRCEHFENRVYQLTDQLPGAKPFFSLLTLSSNRLVTETNNIANGQNQAELGLDIQFNVHQGNYDCLSGNRLRITDFGYVYKSNSSDVLKENGATAMHQYKLTFLDNSYKRCVGTLKFAFFRTGSDPTDPQNQPLLPAAVANVTCKLFNGKNFQWPA
jgi:hypothetical protein